jgi:hypothetical protein
MEAREREGDENKMCSSQLFFIDLNVSIDVVFIPSIRGEKRGFHLNRKRIKVHPPMHVKLTFCCHTHVMCVFR